MSQVSNDNEFRQQLDKLDKAQQRVLAANFIEHVLPLSGDERVARAVKVAADTDASSDELASALRSVTAAALDSHARCGADCPGLPGWLFRGTCRDGRSFARGAEFRKPGVASRNEQQDGSNMLSDRLDR